MLSEVADLPGFFSAVFYNAAQNCILIMNEQGIILEVNPAFTKFFGYTTADLRGQNAAILFTPEDRARGLYEKELAQVLTKGQGSDNNYMLSKDGSRTWVSGESVIAGNDHDGRLIVKMIQNIHLQKEAAIEIERLHDFNEHVLATIGDPVIVIDGALKTVKTNLAFDRLFDPGATVPAGTDFTTLIQPYDRENDLFNHIQRAFTDAMPFSKVVVEIPVSASEKNLFEIDGRLLAYEPAAHLLILFHDITFYKQMEREREDIIGFVAHELRNPLSNIGICNDLMQLMAAEKKFDDMPGIIKRNNNNIQRLNKMIAELYNATKISSGNIQLEIADYNFGQMITEAVETTKLLQPAYDIIIEGESNFTVEGDRYRMMEVVSNYLSNGIKYSNGNTRVLLTIKKNDGMVTVSVKDNGLGIPANELPYIFERFFRAEKTRDLEGLGLGLFLCQRIIRAHRGKVWATSEEGKGSIFYFSVPLALN